VTVESGDIFEVEAIMHYADDAPELLMDDPIRAIYDRSPIAGLTSSAYRADVPGARPVTPSRCAF